MVTKALTTDPKAQLTASHGKMRAHESEKMSDKSVERTVQTEPQPNSPMIMAVGASVPLGLACAALATTLLTNQERVAVAAWVSVAVVGSASVISAAAVSNRRSVSVARDDLKSVDTDHSRGSSRSHDEA